MRILLAAIILSLAVSSVSASPPTWEILALEPDHNGLGGQTFPDATAAWKAIRDVPGENFYVPSYFVTPAPTAAQESNALAKVNNIRPPGNTVTAYAIKYLGPVVAGYCLNITFAKTWDKTTCKATATATYSLGSVGEGPAPPTFDTATDCMAYGAALKNIDESVISYSCPKSTASGVCGEPNPPLTGILGTPSPCTPEKTQGWYLEFPACHQWAESGGYCQCQSVTVEAYGQGWGPTPPPLPDGDTCYNIATGMQIVDDDLGQTRAEYGSPSCLQTSTSGHAYEGYAPYPSGVPMSTGCSAAAVSATVYAGKAAQQLKLQRR